METLWAPWRMAYIGKGDEGEKKCVFCLPDNHIGPDKERLVLFSDDTVLLIMNRYPYNNAHLMVAPRRHVATLALANQAERLAITNLAAKVTEVLDKFMSPHGYNMGINQGLSAGAGIADHLHFHITPRYNGDTNFMTVLGETRVIPEHIEATFEHLLPYFN